MSYENKKNDAEGNELNMNNNKKENKVNLPLLGYSRNGSEVRLAEGKDCFNNFTVVSGKSGSGKTTFCLNLAAEYADAGKTVIMFDGHNGLDADKLPLELKTRMNQLIIPINVTTDDFALPLWTSLAKNETTENSRMVCRRLRDALAYAVNLNVKEKNALLKIIELMDEEGLYQEKGLGGILNVMEDMEQKEVLSASDKLFPLLQETKMRNGDDFALESGCWKLDLNDLTYDVQGQLIEFFLYIIYEVARTGCFKENGLVLYIDEAQMLRFDKNSILRRYIQEGRKLGIGLILSTPAISGKNRSGMEVLFDCATQIYFSPGEDVCKVAQRIDPKEEIRWTYLLKRLKIGEFIACGSFLFNQEVTAEPQRLHTVFETKEKIPTENQK